jgi:multiple sugar transport system ATP-binding protein
VAKPLDLYDNPANQFVAGFIGSPPMNFFNGRMEQESGALVFNEGHFRVRATEAQAAKLGPYAGKEVVFGIRPEDVQDSVYATNPDPQSQIKARVEVMEPMGAEVFLYLHTGKHAFISRVDAHESAEVDQELTMVCDMSKAHFFSIENGETIV